MRVGRYEGRTVRACGNVAACSGGEPGVLRVVREVFSHVSIAFPKPETPALLVMHVRFSFPLALLPSYLLLLLMLSACERPFVDVRRPAVEVVSPDLRVVLDTPRLPIEVTAQSFRDVRQVEINGEPMTGAEAVWRDTLLLRRGLNTLVITAYDTENVAGTDTVYAVYLPLRLGPEAPALPAPRGGHTATRLVDGSLLVAGGTAGLGRLAEADAYRLPVDGDVFEWLPARLRTPRTGHTATLLPDGRVLIVGGARTEPFDALNALVETAELFDPETGRFLPVPVGGAPIRRAFHTASVVTTDAGLEVHLFGGQGDIRYGSSPRLGLRDDLRPFFFRNDSLIAVQGFPIGYSVGAGAGPVSGHTQTLLVSGNEARYFVGGSDFQENSAGDLFSEDVTFLLDYARFGLSGFEAPGPPFTAPRTRHAAARIEPGAVAFFGGNQGEPRRLAQQADVYIQQAHQMFSLNRAALLTKRFGHTATNWSSERILLLGGFDAAGNGLRTGEYVTFATD